MGDLSFFSRFGLTEDDRADCHEILRRKFPEHELMTHKYQGYCSYTVLLFYRPRYRVTRSRSVRVEVLDSRQSGQNRKLQVEQGVFDDEHDDFWNQSLVIQFRPPPFALDVQTANLARTIYGVFAPKVRSIGHFPAQIHHHHHQDNDRMRHQIGDNGDKSSLTMTAQSLVPGLPYSAIQPHRPHLSPTQRARQEALVAGFAAFLARGWRRCDSNSDSNRELQPGPLHAATPHKLRLLSTHLPSRGLRATASRTLAALPLLRRLPMALNHGDVVPGNVMVAPSHEKSAAGGEEMELQLELGTDSERDGWSLAGLVDWAEAEVGPWGVPLYGLEFLLGFAGTRSPAAAASSPSSSAAAVAGGGEGGAVGVYGAAWGAQTNESMAAGEAWRWTYYDCAGELRRLFWSEVQSRVGELAVAGEGVVGQGQEQGQEQETLMQAVRVARDVGILLWFGFAWDEGKINRVVNPVDDPREVLLLETFLGAEGIGHGRRGRGLKGKL